MKYVSDFSRSLQKGTKRIIYIGMLTSIFLTVTGYIIYHYYGDFNQNFSFLSGEKMIECGKAFILCTIFTAAICECCLRYIQNRQK